MNLLITYQEALLVVQSEDSLVQRTASLQREMLVKEYQEVLLLGQDLLSLVFNVPEAAQSDIESFQCGKIKSTHRKTLTQLEVIIKKFEFSDKELLAKLAPSPLVNNGVSCKDTNNSSSVVKIKVSAPRFSGKCRDFATFKRDFKSIVAVSNRSAIEIGALLKESIPVQYKYLIDNFELSEHEQMMNVLSEKFGRARLIVDECHAEIKCMNKLTNNADFISFVNSLD